jgi:hypothetical protein
LSTCQLLTNINCSTINLNEKSKVTKKVVCRSSRLFSIRREKKRKEEKGREEMGCTGSPLFCLFFSWAKV